MLHENGRAQNRAVANPDVMKLAMQFQKDRRTIRARLRRPEEQSWLRRILRREKKKEYHIVGRLCCVDTNDDAVDTPGFVIHEQVVRNLGVRPGWSVELESEANTNGVEHIGRIEHMIGSFSEQTTLLLQWWSADRAPVPGTRHWRRAARPELLPPMHAQ